MTQNNGSAHKIIDRMKMVIDVKKDVDLAEHLGSAKSQPAVWKKRGTVPLNACVALAMEKGVSLDWLVLGRGGAELSTDQGALALEAAAYLDVPAYDLPEPASIDSAPALSWRVPRAWFESAKAEPGDVYVMRVVAEGVFGALVAGDLVFVDRRSCDADGVFLVRFGNVLRIRRLQHMVDGSIRLSVDNNIYAAESVRPDDMNRLEVVGRCFCALGKLL